MNRLSDKPAIFGFRIFHGLSGNFFYLQFFKGSQSLFNNYICSFKSMTVEYMYYPDNPADLIFNRFSDEAALADAIDIYTDEATLAGEIKSNLHDPRDAGSIQANIRNGHVIDLYSNNQHPRQDKNNHSSGRQRRPPHKKTAVSDGNPGRQSRQSMRDNSGNEDQSQPDADLIWLDDPNTLNLDKKLYVNDSEAFASHLAQVFSSTCVRDGIKKVKLAPEVKASADKVPYPVFAIDCNGKIIAWNKAMEEITGTAAVDMIGKGNYAYAVAVYGYARPMLIDSLIRSPSKADYHSRDNLKVKSEVITCKDEMVLLRGRPRFIQGRATRLHDDQGTIIGAVQSIGIYESLPAPQQFGRQSLAVNINEIPGLAPFTPVSGNATAPAPLTHISDTEVWAGSGTGIPIGTIQEKVSTEQSLVKRHKDLYHALGKLKATEDDLLENIGKISQSSQRATEHDLGSVHSEGFSRRVIMEAHEGIIVFNSNLRCILWNDFMEQMTGKPASEVLGERALDMFPALKGSDAPLLLLQALSGEMVESSDITFHIPMSGKQVWVRLLFSALHDSSGNIMGIIGIVQDSTARKVMEYALQSTIIQLMESEEKYRSVFNAKKEPLLLIDTSTRRILDLNDAATDLYGYSREECLSLSLADLFKEREIYMDLLDRQIAGIRMNHQKRKDGTIFPADVSFAYFELKGRIVLLLSIRDLSSVIESAEALRLANTKLNLLIGVTRHDVINHLTVAMGYNDLLKHTVHDAQVLGLLEKQENALQTIHRQIEFTRQYYNLGVKSPVWQNVCDTATQAYSEFVTTISFSCDTRDLEVYADPLLSTVFYNLFDNAIRHGENVFRISVYCTREGADLLLIFGDDGMGIPKEKKERIFNKGFGKHTGLGLFLSREILAITRIDISETGEFEKGARFELRIPAGRYRFAASENPLAAAGLDKMNLTA
jgi:PAS domain S-box-containing protein